MAIRVIAQQGTTLVVVDEHGKDDNVRDHERMQLWDLANTWVMEASQLRQDGKYDIASAIESNAEDLKLWLDSKGLG